MIVFEDSISGIRSAVKSGAFCIGVNDESMEDYGSKITIKNFLEINLLNREGFINLEIT